MLSLQEIWTEQLSRLWDLYTSCRDGFSPRGSVRLACHDGPHCTDSRGSAKGPARRV